MQAHINLRTRHPGASGNVVHDTSRWWRARAVAFVSLPIWSMRSTGPSPTSYDFNSPDGSATEDFRGAKFETDDLRPLTISTPCQRCNGRRCLKNSSSGASVGSPMGPRRASSPKECVICLGSKRASRTSRGRCEWSCGRRGGLRDQAQESEERLSFAAHHLAVVRGSGGQYAEAERI
jgi:hypothetical protein